MPEGPEQNPVPIWRSVLDPVNISADAWLSNAGFYVCWRLLILTVV
jgi:hypothetical protein